MGWMGLYPKDSYMSLSHPKVYLQILMSCAIPQSYRMDKTVHGILMCPIHKILRDEWDHSDEDSVTLLC